MRATFDPSADAAYVTLTTVADPHSVRTVEVDSSAGGSVVLDFDAQGRLLGVEVLAATRMLDPGFLAAAEVLTGDTEFDADAIAEI